MVAVPDLSTLTYTDAITALQNAGLNYTNSGSTNTANSNLNNIVATQSVVAGTLVNYESNISFTYYTYVATPTPTAPTPVAPTPTAPTPTAPTPTAPTPTPPSGIEYYDGTSDCQGTSGVYASAPSVSGPYYASSIPTDTEVYSSGRVLVHRYRSTASAALAAAAQEACAPVTPTAPTPTAPTPTAPTPTAPTPVAPTPTAPVAPTKPACPGTVTNVFSYRCSELGLVSLGGPDVYNISSNFECCGGAIPAPTPTPPAPTAPTPTAPTPTAPTPTAPTPTAPTPTPYTFSTTSYGVKCISGNTFIRLLPGQGTELVNEETGKKTIVDSSGNILAKQAKDIAVGDEVMTVVYSEIDSSLPDYETFEWSSNSLTFLQNSFTTIVDVEETQKIQTVYFNNDQSAQFTLEHPILVNKVSSDNSIWKFAMVAELEIGDTIVKYDSASGLYNNTILTSIDIISNSEPVYTFSAEPGDIIVAGEIVTHNK